MDASCSAQRRHARIGAAGLLLALVACGSSSNSQAIDSGGSTGSGGAGSGGALASGGAGSGGTTSGSGGGSGGVGTGGATSGASGGFPGSGGRVAGSGGFAGNGGRTASGGYTGSVATGGTAGRLTLTGGSGAGGRLPTDAATDMTTGGSDGPLDLAQQREAAADRSPLDGAWPSYEGGAASDGGGTVPDGYRLVWADEFDIDGAPDPKNWNYETGFARNEELQWYQPDNATVKDGMLVIEARKERVANPDYRAGSSDWKTSRQYAEYTSTSMTTSGLQSWLFGRLEMRARIPTGAGMWPAWWTLGVSGEWPSNGEIDIMEYYKGNVLANVACGTSTRWTAKWDSSTKSLSSLGGASWTAAFHVWRMDWDDQKIDLYLDGVLLNSVTLSSMLNPDGSSPFKQKHYMLVNLAIGGVNGGDPSGSTFPVQYEVDWIRVFQKL